ncbi:putative Ig domain-containing protein [Pedobacter sp. L105]|uniref:Ig-like domain-containing protein n=1 Tax=Pedobacter sp. L105 TaxID=1641871 RepID=UPI00131DEE01|nr:putative Ig domain-containing protein [Pedobacter sp. L105]
MKWISTPKEFKNYLYLLVLITLTLFKLPSYGQTKNYATVTPSTGAIAYYNVLGVANQQATPNAGSVTNPGNASANPSVSPAVLSANYLNVLGLVSAEGEAYIELKYAAPVAAGKTTYVRFDQPTITGISLDLLNTIGGLTGLFKNNLVEVDAYTGASAGVDGTMIPAANVTTTIVRDAAGLNYFAVTSSSAYNAVRVRLRFKSNLLGLALGSAINMNVYTAFNVNTDNCGTSIFTDLGASSNLNVSLTSLVTNPERAIDGNTATFSQIQPGLIGLGSSVSQTIYLNGLSGAGDVAKVYLSQPGTVLSVNVLQTVTLQAYNGSTPVGGVQAASGLLNLQLLSLTNNNPVPVFFTPGAPFDRIKISIDNTLSVGGNILSGGLNINEVQRTVTAPILAGKTNGALSICGGSTLTLSALSSNPAYTYNFYKKTNNVTTQVAAATASTYTETGLAAGTYTYYISAQKSGCAGESDRDSVLVTVNPTLVFAATTLTNGSAGKIYSKQITPASGGIPGYTYGLAAGSVLPGGLTISPAGLISGTPSAAGTFNFNLTATDSFGCIKTASYTFIITATLTLPTAVLPIGTVGTAYPSTSLPAPTGGSTPYTYAAVNMPAGLVLDPATGQITGTPTVSGTFVVPVTVTDADGNTVTSNFTIIVRDPLALPSATLSAGTTGVVYPTQIIPSATGGSGVYTYTATNLPPGLTFNPVTREVTGTPSQSGTFTFPVNVSDSEGRTASSNYTIVVKDPLLLGTITLPNGTVGVNYPAQTIPAATGGTGPYTYAATNVPPGLTFDPVTRQISGTPTQSGTFTISVTVTDSNGTSTTLPYTLTVNGTLALGQATLPDGTVGTAYTSPALPGVTGGTSPYTYTMANLPAGLTFNPATRVISGTPAVGGSFTLTMTATDSGGLSTSTDYTLNVNVGDPAVAGMTICSGNAATLSVSNPVNGVTYNFYSATGNTPLFTGANYTTAVLTQTSTFYVQAVSGTAVSNRVAVTVTVNPSPDTPTVITNNATISSGQTATLQATAASGSTIEWYAAATGGVALTTGGSFTTPALTVSTTYYAATVNTTGCPSLTRVPVLVNVLGVAANPNCNAAATQQSGITGLLCVGCSIQNPGNSTDADPANFTQIRLTVGVGATGFQTLIFQRPGAATDSIRLDLETPTGLADLSALGGITINIMNGNTIVGSYAVTNSLVGLSLLSGNRFKATVLAGAAYDRVQVSLNPLVTAISSLNIYGAQVILPNPTLLSKNQTICSGSTASLSATAQGGTTLTWYSSATGGSVLATGGTYTTPALTATAIYFIEVSSNGCANPTRVADTVTVTPVVALPVLATVAPVCSGSAAVLTVDHPVAGITYKWYADAVGGTALATDPVFTTPVLTANATYYLEASNGNCVAASRVAANIVVNPRPVLPQISASATTVNQGQTVSLTGTSTDNNVVFNWYTTIDGTTPVFTGPTYVTPPLTATTTFYLEAASTVTGCTAPMRVQQTITVNGSGSPVPVICETPVSQTNGIAGTLSILARVDNPTLAIDGDQQTGSTLSIPVGINASVFQKVNFTGLSNVGDTVRVLLTSPNQLLSLSVLSGVMLTTYQGATSNNDGTAVNNSLINLQLLNGGAQALISLVPTAQFDGLEVRLNSGIVGALSAINFNYARRITTAPVVAADSVTTCTNTTATLTVTNPQPGITYKWYDAAGVYQGNDGATFVTPVVTASTKFFVEANRNGCGGSRTVVKVGVVPAPLVPALLSPTEQTCQNANLVLKVQNPQTGVTYQWYNGSTAITGATTSTLSVTNIQASAVYAVEAINSCGAVSARATVTVTVGSLTAPVLTPSSVAINSGEQTVLTASSSTSDLTYTWYSDAALTNVVSTPTNGINGTFVTPALSATTSYYVTAQSSAVNGCLSPAATVTVTVTTPPDQGTVPCEPAISQSIRTGGTVSLSTVSNPGFAVDNEIATGSSLFIPFGVNSFVAQKVNFNGVSLVGDMVKLGISSPAGLLSLNVASSITVTTYNGTTSNNDEMPISSSGINLVLLPGGQSATIQFTPGQTFDGVELKLNSGLAGALTGVNFNYAQRILLAPSVSSAAVTVCAGSSATLAVSNPAAGITYNWYQGTTLAATAANSFATPTTLIAGTYNYFVSANRNGCESAKTPVVLTVTATAPPAVPSADNPLSTCLNTPVTLHVDQMTDVTYNWYDALTGGNLLAANTNALTTPAGLAVGTTDFYVEAVNSNSCASQAPRTKVSITINPAATTGDLSVAGAAASFCAGSNVSLTASSTTVTNPVFTWYADAALANPVFTGATFNLTSITAGATYYVTVHGDNKCENTAGNALPVSIQVNPPAVAADITVSGIPASLCAGTAVTLTASSTTVTNPVFTWYSDAALTNAVFTGVTFATPPLTGNTNYYVTVQGANRCPNTPANAKVILLNVNPPATAADINVNGIPPTVCSGSGVSLTASSTTVTNPVFTWYTDAALSNAVFTGAVFNTPALTANTTYYVTVHGDNKCENTAGNASIVALNINPAVSFTGGALANGIVPLPYVAQLGAATGGTPGYTYVVASGNTAPAGLNLSSGGLLSGIPTIAGNYTFAVTASDSKGCNATATFTVSIGSIGIITLPPATVPDGVVGTVYTTQTLPAAVGGTGPYTYVATGVLPPGLTFDPTTRQVSGTPTLGGTFTFTVTVTDANGLTAATNYMINVTVPAPAVAGVATCPGSSATLTVSNPVTGVTYNWYASASGGAILTSGTSFQTPAIIAATTYYAEGVSGTAFSSRTAAAVTLKPNANAADITVSGVPSVVCSGSGVTLTASSTTVTNPVFTWYNDAALSNAVFTGVVFTIPSLTANATYYVTVQGDNKCENIAGTANIVTLSVNPAMSFTGTTLNNATVSTAYNAQLNAATGGTPGYTYVAASGSTLPAGLTLSSTGLLSGTPTVAGNYSFAVTATDSKGCNATATFTLNVSSTGVISLPPATLPDGIVGTVYVTQTLPAAVGGTGPYTYVATGLPPGLIFDPVTRQISGTPTLGGTFTVNETVTDANGLTTSTNYVVNVTVPAPAVAGAVTCSGTPVTLTVSNPVAGVTYNWYAAASGGNALSTGTTFQTPVITASTTYYAEGVSGTASSTRTPVTVTLKPNATAADITVAGIPASICSGSGVTLTASSSTVNNPIFTWYTDPALTNAVFTGAIYTIPALNASTNYYVSVSGDNKCTNASGTGYNVVLSVNPAISYAGTALNNASTSSTYSASVNTATGGTPAYTYTLASGSTLPAGLSLSAGGIISGTPGTTGNYTFSVTATDSKGCNATATFTVTVGTAPNPLNLPPATLPDGSVGSVYATQTLPAATGGTGPYTYIATGLPPGLAFDPATRQISGTPTLGGTFTVQETVTDANGVTATASYVINVTVPGPAVAGATSCSGTPVTLTVSNPVAGVTYNWYAAASGGTALATGTSFQTPVITATTTYYAEGISGTAVSTRTPVTVTVKPNATSADITVAGIPNSICSGSGVTLTAGSTTVVNPVFTWFTDAALTNAVFTGAVYNIPALTASTNYYVSVSGDNKCANVSGSGYVVALAVNPALSFTGNSLSATIGSAYTVQLDPATGGTPGYTYGLASGSSLPADLTLSASGVISGTPAVAGVYTFSVIAIDSKGCSATGTFSISIGTVAPTAISLPPAVLPDGVIGSVYVPQTLPAAVGGTGPFTYAANGLPPGLTFDPSTRQINGTPTLGGTFPVTVTVTDANGSTATGTYVINVTVPAPAIANAASCSGSSAVLTVSNPVTGVTYNWYASPSGGSILFSGTSFETPVINSTTAYYAEGTSGTAVSSRTAVNVVISPVLAAPVVTSPASTFTSITFTWAAVPGASSYEVSTDGGNTWQNPSSGTSGTTHLVSGLQKNESVTLMVRAKGATDCQTSSAGSFTGKADNHGGGDEAGKAVFIPNTFTPNGDGNNDIFYVYGNSIASMKMRIYDQWGHLIYQASQIQNGWDGTYRGTLQPNGVYVYVIDLIMTDGTKTLKKGTVTLLR